MNNIKIKTTQNVEIDYKLAGLGNRLVSYLIDLFVVFLYIVIILIFASESRDFLVWTDDLFAVVYFLLIFSPVIFYDLVCEIFMEGRSIGKILIGLKVVKLDGSKPTIGSYLIRWSTRIIEGLVFFMGMIPVLSIAFSDKAQRLGDLMAGTTVIKTKVDKKIVRNPLDLVEESAEQEEDRPVVYPEAINLTDKDVRIIREVIELYNAKQEAQPVNAVTRKVEELLNIRCTGPQMLFLLQVLADHNYLVNRIKI